MITKEAVTKTSDRLTGFYYREHTGAVVIFDQKTGKPIIEFWKPRGRIYTRSTTSPRIAHQQSTFLFWLTCVMMKS
jgi:hypothetical protein